jgi:cytochrome c oxidase subunit 3
MVKADNSLNRSSFSSKELAAWVAISSFGMLFGTFLLSYLLARTRFPVWPPVGVDPIPVTTPWISTLILALSSLMISRSVFYWNLSQLQQAKKFWIIGVGLGVAFLISQGALWNQLISQGLSATDHLFGGAVYALTGLHALHVVAALGALIVLYFKYATLKNDSEAPKLVGLFWHFLGVVWFLMFLVMVVF